MSKRVKGFTPPQDRTVSPPPERLVHVEVTVDDLTLLFSEIRRRRLTPRCYGLFLKLAQLPPVRRLALNLKVVLDRMAAQPVSSVLPDGLETDELEALKEVDASGMDMPLRQAAHSLLNIEQRAQMLECVGRTFREQRTRASNHYTVRPLDMTGETR